MRIVIEDDYQNLSKKAAVFVAQRVICNSKVTLALPTGETPKGLYRQLNRLHEESVLDFSEVSTFNLDEYYPISPKSSLSFHKYMYKRFFNHVNIPQNQIHIFDSEINKPEKECKEYEELILKQGGIDLAILGIGQNGHIAYNEPGSNWESKTRLVELSQNSVIDDALELSNRSLDKAMTMGIKTIMQSREILLLASGEEKAKIMEKATRGPIKKNVPASILQLHPSLTIYLDNKAAQKL